MTQRTNAKTAFTVATINAMSVKAVHDHGIPILSRNETVDWPNWLTVEELNEVTIPERPCVCGKPHHFSKN